MSRGDPKVDLDLIEYHGEGDTVDCQEELDEFCQNNAVVVFVGDSHLR